MKAELIDKMGDVPAGTLVNKHIELVEKWLADRESVSLEELRDNRYAAEAVHFAADAAYASGYSEADDGSYSAAEYAALAAKYVKKYEELIKCVKT